MKEAATATKKTKALSYVELNVFCEQIALVLGAGISVYEGICILQEEASTPAEQALYQGIAASMDGHCTFPTALEASGAFPPYMVQMVSIGELSGRLDTVLGQLGRYYKREQAMKDTLRYAVSYPMMMVVMMGIVIAVLVGKVLPIFNEVFIDLGSELTGFSKQVMALGLALSGSLTVIMVVLIAALLLALFALRTAVGKQYVAQFQQTFVFTKKLTYKIAVSRFASGMSLMLASGLDTQQSIEMVAPLVNHAAVSAKIANISADIAAGQTFAQAMAANGLFTQTYHRMLSIGERTGNVDEVIENISQRYESEIETTIARLIAMIEPSLVAVLSIVVGIILLAVMLPLMSILSVM